MKDPYLLNGVPNSIKYYKGRYYLLATTSGHLKTLCIDTKGTIIWKDSIGGSTDYEYQGRHLWVENDTIRISALAGSSFAHKAFQVRYTLNGKLIDTLLNGQIPDTLKLFNSPRILPLHNGDYIYYGIQPPYRRLYGPLYFYKFNALKNDTSWCLSFYYNDSLLTAIYSVMEYSPSTIIACGSAYRYKYQDMLQNFLLFIDSSGHLRKTVPLSEPFYPYHMIREDDGTITTVGYQLGKNVYLNYVARIDTNGRIIYKEQVLPEPTAAFTKIMKIADGDYIAAGVNFITDTTGKHVMCRLDKDYHIRWKYTEDTLIRHPAFQDFISADNLRYTFIGQAGRITENTKPLSAVVCEIRDDYLNGVHDSKREYSTIQCFPSIATDEVSLHTSGIYGKSTIELITIKGERVVIGLINAEDGVIQRLCLTNVASGVYRIVLHNNEKLFSTPLIIKR